MKKFEITEETLVEVFNYLTMKPFGEVEKIMASLRTTAQNEIKEPVKEEKKK